MVHTTQQRQATEPYLFSGKDQDIKDWLLKCQDFFGRNPETWASDQERIIYAIGQLTNNSKAQDFGTYYRRSMDGLEGIIRVDTHKYWVNFEKAIKDRFLSSEEMSQAIIKIDQLTYQKDIHDFVAKFRQHNALAGYMGELLRNKFKGKIPTTIRQHMVAGGPVDTDELWLERLESIGGDKERFENETKALKDVNPKPKDKGKGKETSRKGESAGTKSEKRKKTFPKPADWKNLTEKEKEEREKRLGNMSQALQNERRKSNVCIRCSKKGHGQYTCTALKPVVLSISQKRKCNGGVLARWSCLYATVQNLPSKSLQRITGLKDKRIHDNLILLRVTFSIIVLESLRRIARWVVFAVISFRKPANTTPSHPLF